MLGRGQTLANIENATGISVRTVNRLRRLWLSKGTGCTDLQSNLLLDLTSFEVNVSNYSLTLDITSNDKEV